MLSGMSPSVKKLHFSGPMKVVVQKVDSASVHYNGQPVASIDRGLLLYIGISKNEAPGADDWLIGELRRIREPEDQLLCLSQFTLFGIFKGPKPSFHRAERPEVAEPYFLELVEKIKNAFDCRVERGIFGKVLQIEIKGSSLNTFLIERAPVGAEDIHE